MNEKNKYYKTLKSFTIICNENKLWYSLANDTLLSAKTNINYFENSDILEVFITNETYVFLSKKFKSNLVDFTNSNNFYLPTPFFYTKDNSQFIKLIIIIPTNITNVKKLYKNKIKNNYSNLLTFKKGYNIYTKTIFFILKIFSFCLVPLDNKQAFNLLYDENFRGFFAINSLNEKPIMNWFPNLSFQVVEIPFLGLKTNIIKECDKFLLIRYGEKWNDGINISRLHFDYQLISLNKFD